MIIDSSDLILIVQVPEQPEKSDVKKPEIDEDMMDHLVDLGWLSSEFEGTSYYVFGDNLTIFSAFSTTSLI